MKKNIYRILTLLVLITFVVFVEHVYADCNDNQYLYDDGDGPKCTNCPNGYYCDGIDKHQCPGYYNNSGGDKTSSSDCYLTTVSGQYIESSGGSPEDCKSGSYCPGGTKVFYGSTGGSKSCPSGYGKSARGSSQESSCYLTTEVGKFVETARGSQTVCTAGGYCPGGVKVNYGQTGGRTACPDGYTSNSGSTDKNNDCKITCDPGNYHKATEGCILCPVGTFSSGTITTGYGNTVNCTACPDGYTTNGSGFTSRNDCRITCSKGQYHDALNGCKPCPKGTFSSSNIDVGYGTTVNCTPCPDGYTTSSTGADSRDACYVPSDNKKTITANANGGTITTTTGWTNASDNKTATKSVTSGSTIGTLPTVTRTSYTLKEWNTKADGTGTVVTVNTTVTASMTIYAIWTENSSSTPATITANANGGTITATSGWTNATDDKTATRMVEIGSAIGTLPTVTRSGYTLKEWRTKADGTGDVVTSSTTATANMTIYAIWTESTTTTSYTITANANGGKMEIYGDQTGGADSTTNTAGFILYPNAMPGVEYTITMSSATLTSGSATKFSTRCYDLTSDATLSRKDVSFGSNISYTITCPSAANAEHQLVIPIYYGEAGATAGNHVTFSNIKIAVNTGWTNVSGNLTATKSISSGSTYGTLPIAVRPGYTLKEWNTKSDGTGTKVTSSITATANATIYAIWTKTSPDAPTPPSSTTSYQISFDCNGGTGSMSPMSVNFGQTVTLIANACVRTGYTFTGWAGYIGETPIDGGTYSDGDSFDYTFESDMILKAQWNSNSGTSGTYLIHYDANGGTGTMADTEATVDVTGSLRANAFKYSGHTFDGWRAYYVDSDGNLVPLKDSSNNEVELKNKASFKNLYGPNGEEVTLYAQWKVVNPSTGIFVPTVIIGGLLLISAFGYYLVKKKNVVLE